MEEKEKSRKRNLEKIKVLTNIIIIILLTFIIVVLYKNGLFSSTLKLGKNSSKNLLNNGEMLISENGEVEKTVNSSNWDTSRVTIVRDADGKEVPVPKGYVGSNATGENTVNGGYVIYEGTTEINDSNMIEEQITRNQWVWIPVENPNRIYEEVNGVKKAKLYNFEKSGRSLYENNNYEPAILSTWDSTTNLSNGGLTGMTPDKLYQELQKEFDSTIESIEKYGGFYIGRYETGNLSQSKPVVQRMNPDLVDSTWYSMYSKVGYLATNENVKTNMIWGCLWDETLQCLVERVYNYNERNYFCYPEIAMGGLGNYIDVAFNYVNIDWQTVTKSAGSVVGIPTGSNDDFKIYNIYDMAGNAWEWTLEVFDDSHRTLRGGGYENYSNEYPIISRHKENPSYPLEGYFGYRAYLYIK